MRLSSTIGLGALLGAGIVILPRLAAGLNAAFKQVRAE